MTDSNTIYNAFDGFLVADRRSAEAKLARLSAAGPGKIHVLMDFDHTLTAGKNKGQNIGSWQMIDSMLPPEGVAKHLALYNRMRPLEAAGRLTTEQSIQWSTAGFELVSSYKIAADNH